MLDSLQVETRKLQPDVHRCYSLVKGDLKACTQRRLKLSAKDLFDVMDKSSQLFNRPVNVLVVLLVHRGWMTMQARKSTISSPCNYIQARLAAKTIFETGWTFEQHERDPSSRKGEGIVVFFVVWFGPVAEGWLIEIWNAGGGCVQDHQRAWPRCITQDQERNLVPFLFAVNHWNYCISDFPMFFLWVRDLTFTSPQPVRGTFLLKLLKGISIKISFPVALDWDGNRQFQ